jgi:hypothetical protein
LFRLKPGHFSEEPGFSLFKTLFAFHSLLTRTSPMIPITTNKMLQIALIVEASIGNSSQWMPPRREVSSPLAL